MTKPLTHLDEQGRARMVNVSEKPPMLRVAVAESRFCARAETLDRLMSGDLPKGEALAAARLAGILAAKRVDAFIPLCHTLPLEHVEVDFERAGPDWVRIEASATVTSRTGVEMEALMAASVAAHTLWDMTKAIDTDLRVEGTRLLSKTKTPV